MENAIIQRAMPIINEQFDAKQLDLLFIPGIASPLLLNSNVCNKSSKKIQQYWTSVIDGGRQDNI